MRGPFVDPPIARLIDDFKGGASLRMLGRMFDVSASTARNRLRGAGVKMRPRGAPPGNDHARKDR